jgi:hypothetical protein
MNNTNSGFWKRRVTNGIYETLREKEIRLSNEKQRQLTMARELMEKYHPGVVDICKKSEMFKNLSNPMRDSSGHLTEAEILDRKERFKKDLLDLQKYFLHQQKA